MAFAPQQDWSVYESLTHAEYGEWLRGLSPQDRFALYSDMFNLIQSSREAGGDWDRLEKWHWEQKLAARMRQVEAFSKLDQWQRERAASNNAV